MSNTFFRILEQASGLSRQEQLTLISALSHQLAEGEETEDLDIQHFMLSSEAEATLQQRMQEIESGEIKATPWRAILESYTRYSPKTIK